ncbi:hypothetical protein [Vibrio viridaestus]|uniref:hypothetical protein n=1 Tax=Vibrio viridaestus TaxID=2487322 RepID=UPI001FB777FD|nr:hypothetical protein [Vibrio viridaestus]
MIFPLQGRQISSELCHELSEFLTANKGMFEQRLIPDFSHIDHMAHNVNGITVDAVEYIKDQRYRLKYHCDWELFRGCSDIQSSGVERDSVTFTLKTDGQIDIRFIDSTDHDTCNEF